MDNKNENINIIYSALFREKHTILCEYTECSGNFSQIITNIIQEIIMKFENPLNSYRTYFYYGKYAIFVIKADKIYLLTMIPNKNSKNTAIIFSLLYCFYEKFSKQKEIDLSKVTKMRAYFLGKYSTIFQENINLFYTKKKLFSSYSKYDANFELYEPFEDRYFEKDIHLPILSNEQVHEIKEKTNEEINEIEDKEEPIPDTYKSFNSAFTIDSFKDDILRKETELDGINGESDNNNNNEDDNDDDKNEKIINFETKEEIEKKIFDEINPKGSIRAKKLKRIIFFAFLFLIILGIIIGLFFILR